MGQDLELPDWAKAGVPQAFAGLNADEDNLSDGIGQSYPVVSYKGKQWALRYRGERKNFMSPDGFPMPYIDVIILGQAKQKSKSYYAAFDPNSDGGRPLCASIDGVVPDADVQTKQADTCALCPRNQWKQQPNGKKGRDCADFKRLAVLVLPTQTQPLFGQPILEPAFLRVPAASLNSLAIMGDTMGSRGIHYSSYITRISFDPNEAHPKMVFKPLQPLTAAEAPVILGMREDIQVGRIVHGGFAEGIRVVPQEGTTLLPPGQQPTGIASPGSQPQTLNLQATQNPGPTTAGITAQATAGTAPKSASLGSVGAPPATLLGATVSPPTSTGLSTGVGGTHSGTAQPAQTQPETSQSPTLAAANGVGDAGAPEAADADLDSMIAGAMAGIGKPN